MFEGTIQKILKRVAGWKAALLLACGRITLAQSVLSAMPIHVLSAVPVPKGVLQRIDCLICAFLWDTGTEKRRHWLSGKAILQPFKNGGLNVRSMENTMASLHVRLAWKVISRASPWADFVASKYEDSIRSRRSGLWNRLCPLIEQIKDDSLVKIGKGDCKVWDNQWCSPRISKPVGVTFKGSIARILGSSELKEQIFPLLPVQARNSLLSLQLSDHPDKWIWTK